MPIDLAMRGLRPAERCLCVSTATNCGKEENVSLLLVWTRVFPRHAVLSRVCRHIATHLRGIRQFATDAQEPILSKGAFGGVVEERGPYKGYVRHTRGSSRLYARYITPMQDPRLVIPLLEWA